MSVNCAYSPPPKALSTEILIPDELIHVFKYIHYGSRNGAWPYIEKTISHFSSQNII